MITIPLIILAQIFVTIGVWGFCLIRGFANRWLVPVIVGVLALVAIWHRQILSIL